MMSLKNRIHDLLIGKGGNYIVPFFWQQGEEEKVLRKYMQKIHEANIGAVCVESRPHPEFSQDGWWRDMDVILDEAKKLDMKVWILDDKHFPTGYAAGTMENADAELCHQYLDYNVLETWGPRPQMEIMVDAVYEPHYERYGELFGNVIAGFFSDEPPIGKVSIIETR